MSLVPKKLPGPSTYALMLVGRLTRSPIGDSLSHTTTDRFPAPSSDQPMSA